jgi:hypothetical protein
LNGASAFQTSKPENLGETIKTISEGAVQVASIYEFKKGRRNSLGPAAPIPYDTVCAYCKKPGVHEDAPQIIRDIEGNTIDTLKKE